MKKFIKEYSMELVVLAMLAAIFAISMLVAHYKR